MNQNSCDTFYKVAPYHVWNNMRWLSVDGTWLVLSNLNTVNEEFDEHSFGPNADSKRSLAISSFLYDPNNMLTIDAQITLIALSDRELLFRHLEKVNKRNMLLLDRGYTSFALIYFLLAKSLGFCMRMKDDWWLNVKKFSESVKKQDTA